MLISVNKKQIKNHVFYLGLMITLALIGFHPSSFSQNPVDVNYEKDNDGNIKFYCNNDDFCSYIIEVRFEQMVNLRSNAFIPYKTDVRPGRTDLFELKPVNPNVFSTFSYSFITIKGCVNPRIKSDFIYLLPVGEEKVTEAFGIEYIRINDKDPEPKDFYAIGFTMDPDDTVYAARKGTVVSLRDTTKLKLSGYVYSSEDNYIEIVHDDCSFGRYDILSKTFVNSGQKVNAGDPIGLAGGEKYSSGTQVRFSVHYNYEQRTTIKNTDGSNIVMYWAFVPLFFYTKESNATRLIIGHKYTSIHPENIITQEMSKMQISRWKKHKIAPSKK